MTKSILLGFIILSTITLSACNVNKTIGEKAGEKLMEKTIESQTGGKVDINKDGEDVTIKTEDGQTQYSAGGTAKLPDNFPSELIVVDDAKIIMSSSTPQGSSVSYITNAEQSELMQKYIDNLEGSGWKKEMEINSGTGSMLNFSKEKQNVAINIGANDSKDQTGKSMVNVVLSIGE